MLNAYLTHGNEVTDLFLFYVCRHYAQSHGKKESALFRMLEIGHGIPFFMDTWIGSYRIDTYSNTSKCPQKLFWLGL